MYSYLINAKGRNVMTNKYVSGIRPSGRLHLGNYLGVIKNWKSLQDAGEDCYFFVADMHGQYNVDEALKTVKTLANMRIYVNLQSDCMSNLLKLQHELSFHAKTSRLDNMTQYKDIGGTLALYAYPVLMAADILYHKATHVPIGHDQVQHLELARDLARAINSPIIPVGIMVQKGCRIMGLKDPTRKMSKSDVDPDQCIYLCDSADEIARKIKGATTSNDVNDNTPAAINLNNIYDSFGGMGSYNRWDVFKKDLTDLIIQELGAK